MSTYQIKWDQRRDLESLATSVALGREVLDQLPKDADTDARIAALSNLSFRLQRVYLCYVVDEELPTGMESLDGETLLDDALEHLSESALLHGERTLSVPENILTFVMGAMLGRCANVLRIGVKIIKDYCSVASQEDQRDCLNEYSEALHTFRASFTNQVSFHERKSGMERLAKLQDRIRQIPGILGGPERLSERLLLEMAQDRDIVVVSLTDLRSDAILITKAGLRVVPLPSLDEWQLSEDSWEIQTGLATEEDQEEVFHDLHANLSKLLRDLWRNLVNPVLRDLGHLQTLSKSDSWPRIVWIPTGILCLYPIHAAGLGLHKEANAMNRVISSYASSLSSLLRLHENEGRGASLDGPTKVAIMAMPETVDRQPLDLSLQEAAAITRAFPDSELLVNRTTEDVLEVIARQPQIVHFTCHGEVDYDQPLLSKLLTRDWQTSPLTVAQLQVLNIERSRLAFLSACFTANAGVENMQDENNHLAGALHRAGFPSIVGSLWYVGEEAALEVTRRFYEELAKEEQEWPEHVAKALHFAILDFRETTRTAGNKMRGDPSFVVIIIIILVVPSKQFYKLIKSNVLQLDIQHFVLFQLATFNSLMRPTPACISLQSRISRQINLTTQPLHLNSKNPTHHPRRLRKPIHRHLPLQMQRNLRRRLQRQRQIGARPALLQHRSLEIRSAQHLQTDNKITGRFVHDHILDPRAGVLVRRHALENVRRVLQRVVFELCGFDGEERRGAAVESGAKVLGEPDVEAAARV
ncbi:hypothetical protein M7I_7886 [Glarea lozoyensis 74030]|uniref:CHAT domain-containing protein n=1 Tax=Glarea lozoyensis (strain ATCC 74030 / MF5533) TaxID=1104152 RepID=H0EYI4_GLAL7|nr:hypothetical protein M7I_7886 [Glarea lozoyensis 74030]